MEARERILPTMLLFENHWFLNHDLEKTTTGESYSQSDGWMSREAKHYFKKHKYNNEKDAMPKGDSTRIG